LARRENRGELLLQDCDGRSQEGNNSATVRRNALLAGSMDDELNIWLESCHCVGPESKRAFSRWLMTIFFLCTPGRVRSTLLSFTHVFFSVSSLIRKSAAMTRTVNAFDGPSSRPACVTEAQTEYIGAFFGGGRQSAVVCNVAAALPGSDVESARGGVVQRRRDGQLG